MTTFDKLEIAGIRSINPDKPVEIEFFKPLTLITGPNGAGKTTIIESVRYACTGTSPPNSNGGKLFVRDPTMSATKKTDAYINLSLDTSKGKLTISRKLGVSINLGKTKFSAKEAKLELDGQKHDINDGTLTSTIETSAVMLDSVLFCHQEDSFWPFEEPKKLKEKFDDVFGTSNYTKFLDDVSKLQKSCKERSKETELRFVKVSEDYNKLKRDQNEIQKSQHDIDEKKMIKSQKLQEKELKTKEIESLNSQLGDLQKESRRKENYMAQIKRYKDELQNFNRIPSNNRDQLDHLITSLNEEIKKLETQSIDVQQKVNKEGQHQELSKQIHNQMKDQTLLENDLKNRRELEKEINEKIQGVESVEEKVNNEKIKNEEKQKEIEEEKKKEEKELEDMSKEVNEIKNELENRKYNVHIKQDDVNNKTTENERKKKRDQEIQEEINEMKKDIIKKNEEIDDLKKQLSKESFEEKEQKSKIKLEEIKKDIEEIDNEINRALENIQQQIKIERLMKEINENKTELENFKLTVGKDLQGKEKDIKETIKKQKNEILSMKNDSEETKRNIVKIEMEIKRLIREKEEKVFQLNKAKKEINELGNKEKNKERIIQLREMERGIWTAAEQLVHKAMENGICPVCGNKHIDNEVINERKEEIKKMGRFSQEEKEELKNLEEIEKKRENNQKIIEENEERVIQIEKELNEMENQLQEQYQCRDDLDSNIERNSNEIEKQEDLYEQIKEMIKKEEENKRKQEELNEIQTKEQTRSVNELKEIKNQLNLKLKEEEICMQTIIKSKEQEKEKLNNIEKKSLNIRGLTQMIDEKEKNWKRTENEIKELERLITTIKEEIRQENKIIENKEKEVNKRCQEKESRQKNYNERNEKRNKEIKTIQEKLRNISVWETSLKKSKGVKELEGVFEVNQKKLVNDQCKLKLIEQEIEILRQTSGDVQDKINTKKLKIKEYEEDKKYIETKECLDSIQNVVESPNYKECEEKIEQTKKEIKSCENIRDKLMNEVSEIEGELKILTNNILRHKEDINRLNPNGKLETEYDELSIRRIVEKNTIEDLDKYKGAVGRAMTKYHREKMKEINDIINDLWSGVYAAQDIQTVKIVAEDPNQEGARTTYNYRVDMVKDGIPMEMRGRCSMGQKALASVIIRIALAKTFCSKCSVLALDEPTINLDEENCTSLAQQLCSLLESQGKLSNFQIILITHDENFVKKLSNFNEEFYRIERDNENCSCVKRMSFNGLI
ncbi:RecF/RecN/SMC N terminal domain containing protein [Entamoeba histolytica HM-1:IMSS-B]|uniref:Rad50/SbcC-type AAA domain-containing protein n=6 Tax=Entamoeba histolytica TaxID=5759 RepID=C4M2L7_ENTH1|nr:hypothetical protein, conserved [Entamoeba histolytica HM-1:IMSS]EMD48743.1 DNA double strand break repair Rad50 ATPase, putative [Entamoeba histolytica KU27]EMH75207.1 RecF/RecN/SMC N terminal domain containing protein [Entamoeba histolytica HM-1:IMSS-B]EMS12605.1 DNA double-strand break repair Rad50 ATPase, putative [Entamoeba histolytica HM-3:IMSS]ENY62465.1 DNA double-strand break repair Rad50 ATPase, putative [Entamoeba histolytica HM-1:IMSS-A]GAT95522.1 hypothetical protein conserved |eukprot:XP_652875.1 hypothetical protein, conserved [Entamoeba histolytica HM-1:IMSS]